MGRKKEPVRRVELDPLSEKEINKRLIEIGQLVQNRRKELGYDANDFCHDLDISTTRFSKHENHGGNITLITFLQILHGLGIKYEDLISILRNDAADKNSSNKSST